MRGIGCAKRERREEEDGRGEDGGGCVMCAAEEKGFRRTLWWREVFRWQTPDRKLVQTSSFGESFRAAEKPNLTGGARETRLQAPSLPARRYLKREPSRARPVNAPIRMAEGGEEAFVARLQKAFYRFGIDS
jgi:hypothetical protein